MFWSKWRAARRVRKSGLTVTVVTQPDHLPEFRPDDSERRTLGCLSIPRRIEDIAEHLVEDVNCGNTNFEETVEWLRPVLSSLVTRGLVTRIENVRTAQDLIYATDSVFKIPEPKRGLTFDRYHTAWLYRLDGSDQYFWTELGKAFLTGEAL